MSLSLPPVATVILTYDDVVMTRACLQSVVESSYPTDRHAIYLVDNHSRRVPVGDLSREFPDVRYVRTVRNLGVSAGMNAGIRPALSEGPRYVFVLNNDTRVDPRYLLASVEVMESDPSIGVCGSMLLDYHAPRKIQEVGFSFVPERESAVPIGRDEMDAGQHDRVRYVDTVCGAAACYRAATLLAVGLFDPWFFCYWEDTDLCFRIRESGQHVAANGLSKVHHVGNFSLGDVSSLRLYCNTRNYLWFAKRHGFGAAALKLKLRRMPRTLGWLFLKAKRGRIAGAYFRGLLHGWRQAPLTHERLLAESFNPSVIPQCPYA